MNEPEYRWLGTRDYRETWALQEEEHAHVVSGGCDRVLFVEHPPVFTCGNRTDEHEKPLDAGGAEVVQVNRGGKITFHGPGQLVGYPVVKLPDHVYVVDHVRRIEEALIRVCRDLGLSTARVPGRSGVWMCETATRPERKLAAIGIRISRKVSMHGFALNCDVDLDWYKRFVPCGIDDAAVTSLSAELGRPVRVADVLPIAERHLRDLLAWEPYERTPDYPPKPEPVRVVPFPIVRALRPNE